MKASMTQDNIVEVIRSYDELLKRIPTPISFDEAEVLVQIFPECLFMICSGP